MYVCMYMHTCVYVRVRTYESMCVCARVRITLMSTVG